MLTYICILAPWSSGSSALAGFTSLRSPYLPPHLFSNDERTLNTFESLAYRNQLHQLIKIQFPDKDKCSFTSTKRDAFEDFFSEWIQSQSEIATNLNKTHIVLKHALQTFALTSLTKFIQPKFIVLERPVEEIEKTRKEETGHQSMVNSEQCQFIPRPAIILTKLKLLILHYPLMNSVKRKKREKLFKKFCEMSPHIDQLTNANAFSTVTKRFFICPSLR